MEENNDRHWETLKDLDKGPFSQPTVEKCNEGKMLGEKNGGIEEKRRD